MSPIEPSTRLRWLASIASSIEPFVLIALVKRAHRLQCQSRMAQVASSSACSIRPSQPRTVEAIATRGA